MSLFTVPDQPPDQPPTGNHPKPFLELPHSNISFVHTPGSIDCHIDEVSHQAGLTFRPSRDLLREISTDAYQTFQRLRETDFQSDQSRSHVSILVLISLRTSHPIEEEEELGMRYTLLKATEEAYQQLSQGEVAVLKYELKKVTAVRSQRLLSAVTSVGNDVSTLARRNENGGHNQDAEEPSWKQVVMCYLVPCGVLETVKKNKKLLCLLLFILVCTLLRKGFGIASDVLEFVDYFRKQKTKSAPCTCHCQCP